MSDEVWRQLEPHRRGLSRRWTVRLWIAAAAAFLLGVGGSLLWLSPLVRPSLDLASPTDMAGLELDGDTLRVRAVLRNTGPRPVTVLDVEPAGPGLQLRRVEGARAGAPSPFPVTLDAGERIAFVLDLRVVDCAAVDVRYPVPVRATVQRPWGEMVVGTSGMFTVAGTDEELADLWCRG